MTKYSKDVLKKAISEIKMKDVEALGELDYNPRNMDIYYDMDGGYVQHIWSRSMNFHSRVIRGFVEASNGNIDTTIEYT